MLSDEELAYMRATAADARPTSADLLRRTATRTPTGGTTVGWDDPEPVMVRINGTPDEVPQPLADRFEGGTLVEVTMDLVLDVRAGDRLDVSPTERYEVISDGAPDAWATAQVVFARRTVYPARD